MAENTVIFDLRALIIQATLDKALEISVSQAQEIWHVMEMVETGKSLEGLAGAMIQIAMDFNRVPEARAVIEEKAISYERDAIRADSHDIAGIDYIAAPKRQERRIDVMSDITLESLEIDLASSAPDHTAIFPSIKMRALLELFAPIKSPNALKLRLVHDIAPEDETLLTSHEVQLLLTFLREIKRRRAGTTAITNPRC